MVICDKPWNHNGLLFLADRGYVRTGGRVGVGLPINNSWMRMKSPLGDPVPIRRWLHHHFRRREGWPCGRKTGGTGMTKKQGNLVVLLMVQKSEPTHLLTSWWFFTNPFVKICASQMGSICRVPKIFETTTLLNIIKCTPFPQRLRGDS